jgi:hypothetical protein
MVILHQKLKDATAGLTTKAMKDLQVRIDVETGSLFLVERTQGLEVRPCSLERDVCSDNLDDVTSGSDLVEYSL